jgi:AAA domain
MTMTDHVFDPAVSGFCRTCEQPDSECAGTRSQNGRAQVRDRGDEQVRDRSDDGSFRRGLSWRPVDLTAALDGGNVDAGPVLLERDDGLCLFYNGKIHTISGESESLKTWLVLLACVTVINQGYHALFVDYEDSADGIVGRLTALGCAREVILGRFHYVRPGEPYGPPAVAVLARYLPDPLAVVVIDGVTEGMAAHGLDPLSNADVAAFNARLPRPFADTGAIVAMIDHVTKNREARGRYAIGAQHKLAAVDGAAYVLEVMRPFGRGLQGMARIIVAKDRAGHVRGRSPGNVAGFLHLRSEPDGSVIASIAAPKAVVAEDGAAFRPTILMQRISEYIESTHGMSGRAIIAAVKGKAEHKRLALELLIKEGYVVVERAASAHRHESLRPFRDSAEGGSGEA